MGGDEMTICGRCRQPIDPDAPDTVRAGRPLFPDDPSSLEVSMPELFHAACGVPRGHRVMTKDEP